MAACSAECLRADSAHSEQTAQQSGQQIIKMVSSASDMDENALLLMLVLRRRRRRLTAACRTTWVRSWIQRRQRQGVYANLHRELDADDPILAMVGPVSPQGRYENANQH